MLDYIKQFIGGSENGSPDRGSESSKHEALIAICALFLEMGRVDDTFNQEEIDTILRILRKDYGLTEEEADHLMSSAEVALKESVDLWHFARRINETYDTEQKIKILERLWKIVYVDGKLDAHEDYLMHKLEQLLRLTHAQLIDAKVKILHANNGR